MVGGCYFFNTNSHLGGGGGGSLSYNMTKAVLRLTQATPYTRIILLGKVVPIFLSYYMTRITLKGKCMKTKIDSTLSALLHSAEVKKNIETEAQHKAEVEKKTARAMDRVSREWQ